MKREPNEHELKSRERVIYIINTYCDGSQIEFAQRVGIGKSSVSQYVNGRNFPSNARAGQIAKAFGLNPLWVMGFDVPKRATEEQRKEMIDERLSRQASKLVDSYIKEEAFQAIAKNVNKLNLEGIDRLVEYSNMLVQNENYTERK